MISHPSRSIYPHVVNLLRFVVEIFGAAYCWSSFVRVGGFVLFTMIYVFLNSHQILLITSFSLLLPNIIYTDHYSLFSTSIYIYKMPVDLLHPSAEQEASTHKLKRLVQSPNSFFMDIKCPGCFQITTVFSHAQSVVLCGSCNVMLCQPTGGRARLTEGCSYRKKVD